MKNRTCFRIALCLLAAFVLWTAAVCIIDVRTIGPGRNPVGFGSLNSFVHQLTGVHMALYTLTDWLSLIPLTFILSFSLLGLCQWIHRKSLFKVDQSILVLGGFYLVTMAVYGFFEACIINYRPVLIEGILEASYPSSTTMLVMCVMPAAAMELQKRIQNPCLQKLVVFGITCFTIFMVIGRMLSGVHWITDIVGGALISAGLVMLYMAFV